MILSDLRTNFSSRWSSYHAAFEDEWKRIWLCLCAWPSTTSHQDTWDFKNV